MNQSDFNEPIKYLAYSAHDTTLAPVLIAMDTLIHDFHVPYYASGLLKNQGSFKFKILKN